MQTIAIVDYGMGNVRSVLKALEFVAPNDQCLLTNESQIINDFEGQTLVSCSSKDKNLKKKLKDSQNKTDLSAIVGKNLAKIAKKKKITKVVFDRNGYPFHGRVKAFADAAREAGLEF